MTIEITHIHHKDGGISRITTNDKDGHHRIERFDSMGNEIGGHRMGPGGGRTHDSVVKDANFDNTPKPRIHKGEIEEKFLD